MKRLLGLVLAAGLLVVSGCDLIPSTGKDKKGPEGLKPLPQAPLPGKPFRAMMEQSGVSIVVTTPPGEPAAGGTWRAEIRFPDGRSQMLHGERDGSISNTWLRDLLNDGKLDLVITTMSVGTGNYGAVKVYQQADSLFTERRLKPLDEDQLLGYVGQDTFSILNGELMRSFPVYLGEGANAQPTGGTARFAYSFEEDAWVERP